MFPGDVVSSIRTALLTFFDDSARELPWRRSGEPYAVWVSEVMAQQTRVETVVPYYERWLERFPDIAALASAPVDDALKLWEGLGYYSRARNMHAAARLVRERHDGALPRTYADLRALPGIGAYTAGAVASIAFGEAVPAVDGNVRRVLARLLDEPAPSPARLHAVAAALLPSDRPGDFNQALMELGATVCTPRTPRCARCPIAQHCRARAAGTQHDRPRTKQKAPVPIIDVVTVILRRRDGHVLITRRPETGLLAGLWEFPGRQRSAGEDAHDVALDVAGRFVRGVGTPRPLCTIEHAFSHRRERYDCYVVDATSSKKQAEAAWIGTDRSAFTLPRAQQRIHAYVFGGGQPVGSTSVNVEP
jgi:A/G-specific adenine glycosylase